MLKKIRNVFIAIQLFLIRTISKGIELTIPNPQPAYGIYTPPNPIAPRIVIVSILALLFVLGVLVLFSKKIVKVVKIITISILALIIAGIVWFIIATL